MLNKITWSNGEKPFQTKVLWLALMTSPFVGSAYASPYYNGGLLEVQQTLKITGKVVDANTNTALSNVTIQVNGQTDTATKTDGTFSIDIPAGADVRFNLIGYESYTQKFTQAASNVTISLRESSENIDEVVVTALGIKRDQKALGYASTTVSGEDLTNAISNIFS